MSEAEALPRPEDRFLDELLELIDEEKVIPIIGRDLLEIEVDGKRVLLYDHLAARLAADLQIDCGAEPTLNGVVCKYLETARPANDLGPIYRRLKKYLQDPIELPKPLLQLAEIDKLELFIALTFDPLLQRALDEVRFHGEERTRSYAYSLDAGEEKEIPKAALDANQTIVYYLFGRVSASPQYAVTDEETLEYVHSLPTRGPATLFSAVDKRHLLIIGSNFDDWLARFFMRAAMGARFWFAHRGPDYVADARLNSDRSLATFIERYGSNTRVIAADPIAFVDALHHRWTTEYKRKPPVPSGVAPFPEKAIFLSYSRDDKDVARAIYAQLDAAGLDCWMDERDIEPGDDFEHVIRTNLLKASMFVPVLSQTTLTKPRAFFRFEWEWAVREAISRNTKFIFPIAIDDVPVVHDLIPTKFRDVHWERAPRGQLSKEFIDMLIKHMESLPR